MKLIKFIKENKIIVLSLLVVILSFVFLALPGQFAHFVVDKVDGNRIHYAHNLSGYQWMFGTYKVNYEVASQPYAKVITQGVAIFVLLILSAVGLLFSGKSSFVSLLTSLVLITVAILFFTSSAPTIKAYNLRVASSDGPKFTIMSWVPYVLGSLVIVAGLLMSYRTFKVMKEEVKRPVQSKSTTYSYLHK